MQKEKLNITVDKDLIEYIKTYAEYQRTSVSEVVTQFILNLKRVKEDDPTETILADPEFNRSLQKTASLIKSGKMKWRKYKEVF